MLTGAPHSRYTWCMGPCISGLRMHAPEISEMQRKTISPVVFKAIVDTLSFLRTDNILHIVTQHYMYAVASLQKIQAWPQKGTINHCRTRSDALCHIRSQGEIYCTQATLLPSLSMYLERGQAGFCLTVMISWSCLFF